MSLARVAWIAQLATSLPLVGLIWFVQIVAYPLFARVGPSDFVSYHQAHSRLITFVVAPLMLVELLAATAWVVDSGDFASDSAARLGLALVLIAWVVTGFVSVPQHTLLGHGFDADAHRLLVASNWIRTLAWSSRGVMLLTLLSRSH